MKLTIPELSLVVLIGASGSGKSTFARRHFKPTEVISSDYCRALVSDDENSMDATNDAFEVLHFIASKRLAAGKLTVIDATNVQPEARKPLVELARKFHCLPVAIILDTDKDICQARNESRPDRNFGPHVIRKQHADLRRSRRNLKREGFRYLYTIDSPESAESVSIERQRLWTNKRDEHGPFDIIGDIHGCYDELIALLRRIGYCIDDEAEATALERGSITPPAERKAIFLGDLVDRGPKSPQVVRLVMKMVEAGMALCVPGNHDEKLKKRLSGAKVQLKHGLAETIEQFSHETEEFRISAHRFLDGLISHFVLDDGRLVVAHAGMKAEMQGRGSGVVRSFALYGETTGETDEFGLPVRLNWAAEYRGKATVVYGHTPVPEAQWLNRTINIDTGCVFGGSLTALRYPEMELVSVPALRQYYEPAKPLALPVVSGSRLSAQQEHDDLLDIEDVTGKRVVATRIHNQVTIREENAIAALEIMSRFAVDPKWLIYLPPTMSPSETSQREGLLEHPADAFDAYRKWGVSRLVCEEKHMGSRAIAIVCKGAEAARQRFGVIDGEAGGVCYTRTGRPFFNESEIESEVIRIVREALDRSGFWNDFSTDWVCLDCELMPWSAKAQELLRTQYAPVGAAAKSSLAVANELLTRADGLGLDVSELERSFLQRSEAADRYVTAYRHYCWPVNSVADLKLAPFHLLATEGKVHVDQPHEWHMETLRRICDSSDSLLFTTNYRAVDLGDESSENSCIGWWEEMTQRGGEGMVIKPSDFIVRGKRGLVQPAIKCRGREYLRIIYGPEYSLSGNLERLRKRGLSAKRSLALREFALGVEGLHRFVEREPLRRVHECAFGVLALESEPVDPRL